MYTSVLASLAVGILMDAFGVRTLLAASTVALLGRWDWWPSAHGQPAQAALEPEPAPEPAHCRCSRRRRCRSAVGPPGRGRSHQVLSSVLSRCSAGSPAAMRATCAAASPMLSMMTRPDSSGGQGS